MHIDLPVTTVTDYFNRELLEIDYFDEHVGEEGYVTKEQGELAELIVLMELSVYTLRQCTGSDQSMSDRAMNERRKLIDEYEAKYEKFYEYNYEKL